MLRTAVAIGFLVCIVVVLIVVAMYRRQQNIYDGFHQLHCVGKKGTKNQNQLIPKRIYRTWKTATLPPIFQEAWDFTARHNPEYEQILCTDTMARAFMSTFMGGYARRAYEMLVPGAAKADLLRYCLMYEYGGVYLDGKSGAKSLRDMIRGKDKMLISTWNSLFDPIERPEFAGFYRFGEFQQWWLACVPRHPFMKKLIEKVVRSVDARLKSKQLRKAGFMGYFYNIDVLKLTGPLVFSAEVIDYVHANGDGIRMLCENGNGIMVYDVSGKHKSGVDYGSPGPMLRNPEYVWGSNNTG